MPTVDDPVKVMQSDCIEFLNALPDDSVDLLFTSPPYELARTYGIGHKMVGGQKWVDWMVAVVTAAAPKVKGLIAINCEGQTRNFAYSGAPFLLFADLLRAGFNMRKPPIFGRVGIPGSGGPDWLRNDYEPIICVTRKGKLPWSDNTACGHAPKWAPGGEMAHRVSSGKRVNQWGPTGSKNGGGKRFHHGTEQADEKKTDRPSHKVQTGGEVKTVPTWLREGMHTGVQSKVKNPRPQVKKMYSRNPDDSRDEDEFYVAPATANPGNKLQATYTVDEVRRLLARCGVNEDAASEVIECVVGGGAMGDDHAHENEAPFPMKLADFFVKSFCPPGGIACDPFCGSGTVAHSAVNNGRRFIGCDVRESQAELTARRMASPLGIGGLFDTGVSPVVQSDLFNAAAP